MIDLLVVHFDLHKQIAALFNVSCNELGLSIAAVSVDNTNWDSVIEARGPESRLIVVLWAQNFPEILQILPEQNYTKKSTFDLSGQIAQEDIYWKLWHSKFLFINVDRLKLEDIKSFSSALKSVLEYEPRSPDPRSPYHRDSESYSCEWPRTRYNSGIPGLHFDNSPQLNNSDRNGSATSGYSVGYADVDNNDDLNFTDAEMRLEQRIRLVQNQRVLAEELASPALKEARHRLDRLRSEQERDGNERDLWERLEQRARAEEDLDPRFHKLREKRRREKCFAAQLDRTADDVDCSVFAAEKISIGRQTLIQVYLHIPTGAKDARYAAMQVDPGTSQQITRALLQKMRRGSEVSVLLDGDGLIVRGGNLRKLKWTGRQVATDFIVRSPVFSLRRNYYPTVRLVIEGVPVGRISFAIKRSLNNSEPSCVGWASSYRHVFLSYASEDRVEVLKRAQALQAANISFFQDILTLKPADRWENEIYSYIDKCDLFLLFWSKAAKTSKWVTKETKYALSRRGKSEYGLPEILPVIIEGPPPVAPPSWLRHLHFNDPICYVIFGSIHERREGN